MKASEVSLLKILDWTKQFLIPTYQRTYSRTQKQCQQLWDDILRAWSDSNIKSHFIWGVVRITEKDVWWVSILSIIDWQQRVTTISLLLIALANTYRNRDEPKEASKILNRYIIVDDEELRYKLLPTKLDKDAYIRLVDNYNDLSWYAETQIITNYTFFLNQINSNLDKLDVIMDWVSKLYIVDIALERWEDNPQLIFESMNSTGLALSKAELIKNYLLMWVPAREQSDLYLKYRYPMDALLERNQTLYDDFVRDYLIYSSDSWTIPTYRELYDSFKAHYLRSEFSVEEMLKDIYGIFKRYARFTLLDQEQDKDIHEVLKDIDNLKVNVAYPLMIELFNDYNDWQWVLQKNHLIKMLRAIESYVFRRAICGIPTSSLNKTFATFKKNLVKSTSTTYYESFMVYLLSLDSYRLFPSDELFKSELMIKDVYSFRNNKYLLEKIENHDRREKVSLNEYSIEHILPQNKVISSVWQKELGHNRKDIYSKYVNSIGNLTLIHIGNNSAFSDNSFTYKKTLDKNWFNSSPLYLNESVRSEEVWNEDAITRRANMLANKATMIWHLDAMSEEIQSRYKKANTATTEYWLENYRYLNWAMLDVFLLMQERILWLHPQVEEHCRKLYIAYTYDWNFACIEPKNGKLRVSVSMDIEEIIDPRWICMDISWLWSRWTGNVSFHVKEESEIEYALWLIQQSLDKQLS